MDLKTKIEGLKKAIAEHDDFSQVYQSDLAKAEQELKDYNKPELTPEQFDAIFEAVEAGVEKYDFSDTDNYEVEYGIDYDGKVYCESHEFRNSDDLVQMVVEKVSKLFAEATCPEELDTTEPDHHKPVETQPVVEEITVDGGETEVTVTPTEDEMEDFNKKIEETKEKKFKKRTWF